MADTNTQTGETVTGRVKWFNSKSGYGFLTVVKGECGEVKDVFVHHSAISVKEEQYKYLVQGEYVDFTVLTTDDDDHPHQAGNVTGVGGGLTMCETRNEIRKERDVRDGGEETRGNNETGRGRNWRGRGNARGGGRNGDSSVKGLVRQELWNLLKDSGQNGKGSSHRHNNVSE